jgi:hypothetical protein
LTSAQAEAAARLLGIDAIAAERWDWTVDAASVRHVLAEHGDAEAEARRGQRAVRTADFGSLPAVVERADAIAPGGLVQERAAARDAAAARGRGGVGGGVRGAAAAGGC